MVEPVYIVHVDAGPSGALAWSEGVRRAHYTGARLVALRVTQASSRGERVEQAEVSDSVAHEELAARASADGAIGVRILITTGDPAEVIVRTAEDFNAALVILGDPVAADPDVAALADRVIRHAYCAVLVVRDVPETGVVVGGTDFSDSTLPVVTATCAEADVRPGGRAIVAHSREPVEALTWTPFAETNDEAVDDAWSSAELLLRRALERHPLAEATVIEGPPGSALATLAKDRGAELLVVGTIGRTGLPRLLFGNVAEHAVREASCSVLVVRLHR